MSIQRFLGAFSCAGLLALAASAPGLAFVTHAQSFNAVKVKTPPPMDASLTDPIWDSAVKATGFQNFTTRVAAKYETTALFLYDDKNIYIGVRAQQAGAPITATQTVDHAGVLSDDHFSVVLDTSGNGSRVYSFKITPKGIHDETSTENSRYAPQWASYARILPNGDWNGLMVIPLSDIRAQGSSLQDWKFNYVRVVASSNEMYTWAFEDAQSDVQQAQFWPVLHGLQIASSAARPKPRADVYVLGTTGTDRNKFQDGFGSFGNQKLRSLGIDATVPLTNTVSLVGTLNPDFSNVEQDQTQIAPSQFQRYYSEYRPFFAQGASYINSMPQISFNAPSDSLFYTPSIGIFNRGLKIEGTASKSSFGILNAGGAGFSDTAFGYKLKTRGDGALNLGFEGVLANHAGLRDRTVGFSAAANNPRSGAMSIVRYETESGTTVRGTGTAHSLLIHQGLQNQKITTSLTYMDIGPEFNPVDGFTLLNDRRGGYLGFQFNGVARGGAIKSYNAGALVDRFVDYSGAPRQADVSVYAGATFRNLLSVNVAQQAGTLRFYDEGYPVYSNGQNYAFNQPSVQIGYRDGTPAPVDFSYSWGQFGGAYIQQMTSSTSQTFGQYGLALEFDGTIEHGHPIFSGPNQPALNTQWFRRFSLTRSFGPDTSLAVGLRSINGMGGFAAPGTNLALSFHKRFRNQDELFLDYGTPASRNTLHRALLKYVFHTGGSAGT